MLSLRLPLKQVVKYLSLLQNKKFLDVILLSVINCLSNMISLLNCLKVIGTPQYYERTIRR